MRVTYDPLTGEKSYKQLRGTWEIFTDSVDWDVAHEKRGDNPGAGSPNWRDYWIWRVNNLRKEPDGGREHIRYIIEARRKAGLPEIPEILPE